MGEVTTSIDVCPGLLREDGFDSVVDVDQWNPGRQPPGQELTHTQHQPKTKKDKAQCFGFSPRF